MKNRSFFSILLFFLAFSVYPENLSISQIDTSSLLLSQKIDLFLSITDDKGESLPGLDLEDFTVSESTDGKNFPETMELIQLEEGLNREQGIHILLLLDNSGSMYDTMEGLPAERQDEMRITQARDAVENFIDSSFNPRDVVSLASFNTRLTFHSDAVRDPSALEGLLTTIRQPDTENAYTELYHALDNSAVRLSVHPGRKVVVVLSDGENYPYFTHSGTAHPEYLEELKTPDQVTETYQKEGITLYAVHFGINKDRHLGKIALESGGNVYDARNSAELTRVYRDIKEKIEKEYRLTYRAGMRPSDMKYVRVTADTGKNSVSSVRHYYSSTIFGLPADPFPYPILFVFPAALLIWTLLLVLRYRKLNRNAALEVLHTGFATKVSAATIPLATDKTIIGGGERADLTLSGLPSLKPEHATILRDPSTNSYTITGDANLTVNNRPLKGSKKLTDGDVLGIEGTTIVFDEGEGASEKKEST